MPCRQTLSQLTDQLFGIKLFAAVVLGFSFAWAGPFDLTRLVLTLKLRFGPLLETLIAKGGATPTAKHLLLILVILLVAHLTALH